MTQSTARRVDLQAQLAHGVDAEDAMKRLREKLVTIPNVLATPAPTVAISEFSPMGAVLVVRPYCDNAHYWPVFFATNAAIREVFGAAGYPSPYTQQKLIAAA